VSFVTPRRTPGPCIAALASIKPGFQDVHVTNDKKLIIPIFTCFKVVTYTLMTKDLIMFSSEADPNIIQFVKRLSIVMFDNAVMIPSHVSPSFYLSKRGMDHHHLILCHHRTGN
jgi:hypothetical protein